MPSHKQPLAEVFGHLITDHTKKATRYRSRRLCPFNNKVPSCTKDKAKNPLGVYSIYHEDQPVITYPIRFREEWITADDAASFFFDESATWSSLIEVRLNDAAWLIYDLKLIRGKEGEHSRFTLRKIDEVFADFEPASSFPRT